MLIAFVLATIISTTDATADTGGNSVGAGGTVVTGAESASATVTNVVGEEDGKTTVTTEVTKEVNGVVTHETTTTTLPPGEPAVVNVEVSSESLVVRIAERISHLVVRFFSFFWF